MERQRTKPESAKKRKEGSERRCIVVGAGEFFGIPFPLRDSDLIIAADAGYEYLRALGIKPALVVGDFDSMLLEGIDGTTGEQSGFSIFEDAEKAEYLHSLRRKTIDGIEFRIIDPVKNDPDLLACVRIGMLEGCTEFHLLGGTGKRIDHTAANFQILGFLSRQGLSACLYGETQLITAITNEEKCFPAGKKGYFSALSLSDRAIGVTETGFKYFIREVELNNCLPTGLSNEFTGEEARISVREGTLLLIYDIENGA